MLFKKIGNYVMCAQRDPLRALPISYFNCYYFFLIGHAIHKGRPLGRSRDRWDLLIKKKINRRKSRSKGVERQTRNSEPGKEVKMG